MRRVGERSELILDHALIHLVNATSLHGICKCILLKTEAYFQYNKNSILLFSKDHQVISIQDAYHR